MQRTSRSQSSVAVLVLSGTFVLFACSSGASSGAVKMADLIVGEVKKNSGPLAVYMK